jgi:hypothetical protein
LRVPSPLAGEGQGEGCAPHSAIRHFSNEDQHTFQVLEDIVVRESLHNETARCQPSITRSIASQAFFEIVRLTIEFNDKPCGVANEVNDVSSHRRLATKREAVEMTRLEITP